MSYHSIYKYMEPRPVVKQAEERKAWEDREREERDRKKREEEAMWKTHG